MAKHKKSKKHQRRQKLKNHSPETVFWPEADGLHALVPGVPPNPEMLAEMTRVYQENIRNSPLWELIVQQYGPEMAEKILKECRVEVR
jgi:hypothetical protein